MKYWYNKKKKIISVFVAFYCIIFESIPYHYMENRTDRDKLDICILADI